MSQLTFDLTKYGAELIGNYFEIQIELHDSYKRLHKSAPISQVLITPEFYGHKIQDENDPNDDLISELNDESLDENLLNLVVVTEGKKKEERKK